MNITNINLNLERSLLLWLYLLPQQFLFRASSLKPSFPCLFPSSLYVLFQYLKKLSINIFNELFFFQQESPSYHPDVISFKEFRDYASDIGEDFDLCHLIPKPELRTEVMKVQLE